MNPSTLSKKSTRESAFFNLRGLIGLLAILAGAFLALFVKSAQIKGPERAVNPMSASGGVQEEWVARYNGPGNYVDEAHAIATDSAGNVYVTGGSFGSGTDSDYATIKYDSSGQVQWVARYNGTANSNDSANAIAVDSAGNVYVTGESISPDTDYDYATVKYNSSGQQQWVARYNGTANSHDTANRIAIDSAGNVYVTGQSVGPRSDYDYATVKYNSFGQQQWVARYNGPANSADVANGIAIDGAGNVYVTGQSFGVGAYLDYATIKYNADGQQQWLARYDGPGNGFDEAHAIAVDAAGNVYVTGESVGGYYDYATIKYNTSGQQQWVARYNGPQNSDDDANAIAIDSAGNVYVTGESVGSGTNYDYATVKYDSSGQQQWVARYNGPGNGFDEADAIAVDNAGNVYVTGQSSRSGSNLSVEGAGNLGTQGLVLPSRPTPTPTPYRTPRPTPTPQGAKVDYATVKYNSSGQEQWVARYNGPGNSEDEPNAIAVDNAGNVYVTGQSGPNTALDYATIKYSQF